MTDTPDLREKITALFRDGSLYRESPQAIADAVLAVVEPLLTGAQLDVLERGKALDRAEASRRDWATEAVIETLGLEALQRRREVEFEAFGDGVPFRWEIPHLFVRQSDWPWVCKRCGQEPMAELHQPHAQLDPGRLCACPSEQQAADLVAAGWSLPQCSVHEDRGTP